MRHLGIAGVASATAPDFSKLLDEHLLAQRAAEGDREVTAGMTWRASKIGSCLKQQYLEFHLKQPKLEEFTALSLRRFEVGHQWGRQFARWFKAMGYNVQEEVELYSKALDLGAHGDYIIDREINGKIVDRYGIELKSVNSKWFWYRAKEADTTASIENMMQAACYDILYRELGLDSIPCTWIVLTVSKDDLTMNQDIVTEKHREEALLRIESLNIARTLGEPPPCTCLDNWNWKFCPYYEGDREAARARGAKPMGKCCEVLR